MPYMKRCGKDEPHEPHEWIDVALRKLCNGQVRNRRMNTPTLIVEIVRDDRSVPLGQPLTPNTPAGSISSIEPDETRQVYMFGWFKGERGVWWSGAGYDVETPSVRGISSAGMIKLSDVEEPYELTIYRTGKPMLIRFSIREATP